jgi:hypothetical protein
MADMDDPRARAITSGVVRDRRQATAGITRPSRLSRYPTRAPSTAFGHVHLRTRVAADRSGPLTAVQRQE